MINPYLFSFALIGLVALVFIVLKLAGVVAWPWWAVLLPIWSEVIALIILLAACVWLGDD